METACQQLSPDVIAELCFEKYRELPRTGKPVESQWTVLAGIVLNDRLKKCSRVVSLGLGTKCIGASKMCQRGLIINDAHAEVLARRGLMRYLYYQMKDLSPNSILQWDEQTAQYEVKPEYSFHFFSSKSPCGDASIVEDLTDVLPSKRLKLSTNVPEEIEGIGQLLSSNVIYTGAKLFGNINETADRMVQTPGSLRIKPGKGDRTLSMSCSDKLSKWCFLGVQGALLDVLMRQPIYFASLNFGYGCDLNALQRATFERWRGNLKNFNFSKYKWVEPNMRICSASKTFEFTPSDKRQQPSPNGIVWCDIPEEWKPYEIIVNGKRQGCTKKVLRTPQAALNISKYCLFKNFIDVLNRNDVILKKCNVEKFNLPLLQYGHAKQLAASYQEAWLFVKADVFGHWTIKPTYLLDFVMDSSE